KSRDTVAKKPKAASNDPWNLENESADDDALNNAPWASKEEEPIGHLEALAPPEGDSEMRPTTFRTQAAYKPKREKPSGLAGAIGTGLLDNMAAMWNAMVNPTKGGAGSIALKRKLSMGGSFLLISGLLMMFFGAVQPTTEQLTRVQSVLGTLSTARWANAANTLAPLMTVGIAGCIAGLLISGWRFWSPRQEEEAQFVNIVYWGTLGLVVVSSVVALFGGAELTLLVSRIGSIAVLIAAAAFGAWVYLRLTAEADGSMAMLLVLPAIIMPATFLVIIVSNIPEGVSISDLKWDKLLLITFLMFLFMILLGGAISFAILIGLPLEMLGVVERPPMPADVPGGAGGMGMMLIGGFCGLCYLLLVIARWRVMLKPVGWQFVMLVFGVFLMLSLQSFAYRTLVAEAESQIAEEDKRLTALLQAEGTIPPNVTASHERFPGNQDVFVGFDREEVVFLSNGESFSRKGGFEEGWIDPDIQELPKFTSGSGSDIAWNTGPTTVSYDPGPRPELAEFDPTFGKTDPGPVRFIDPDIDTPPDLGRIGGPDGDDGPELTIRARNGTLIFDKKDLAPGEVNPDGIRQPGKLASWMAFPNSPRVIQALGAKPLFTAKGAIVLNPSKEQMMTYGLSPDTRPQPVLVMTPQFDLRYLPKGYVGPPLSQRTTDTRYGEPDEGRPWPDFIQPPTVDVRQVFPFAFLGYEFDVLPGYKVVEIVRDDEQEMWTLTIAREDEQALDHPPLQIHFVDSDDDYQSETYRDESWDRLLDPLDVDGLDPYQEFGLIAGERFARMSPDAWRLQSQSDRYYYVSQMHGMRYRISMSISSAMQSPSGILECEAMARSLRRLPVSELIPMPFDIEEGAAVTNDAETIAGSKWQINGNFAYPEMVSKSLRAEVDMETNRKLSLSWAKEDVGIFIELSEARTLEEPGHLLIQERGPETLPERLGGMRSVYAFGREVTFDRLWEEAPFVRINRGPTELIDGATYSEVVYYGWLGEMWAEVTLRGREDLDLTLGELEAYLRQFRLAYPIEITKLPDYEQRVRFWISSGTRVEDMPLAGGIAMDDAFKLEKESFRDPIEDATLVISDRIDPYGGHDPGVFSQDYTSPTDPSGVLVDPEPEVPEGFEPVEGFENWTVNERVTEYLGGTESLGRFRFQPLKDLRASSKNSSRYAEWFARTGSGKVGMTLKFEKLLEGQEPIKVPLTTDPATGEVTLELGRREFRPQEKPDVTYRDGNGLRIWRVLMPQAGGSAVRRCYYLVSLPDGHLVIAADYERDKAVQLQAMDASVASLVDSQPPKNE
ncbi:MAG: hypothetical protein AAGI37_15975, partial [Planctomycetota bacterium]